MSRRSWLMAGLAALAAGCGDGAPPAAGTGAREAVVAFYRAVAHQEWDAAYALLDPNSQRQCNRGRFAALGAFPAPRLE